MNAADVLYYGNQTVIKTVEGLSDKDWQKPNVCGVWSTKDIIAHLGSFEHLLFEVLCGFTGGGPTPVLKEFFFAGPQGFNDLEVSRRALWSPRETYDDYVQTCAKTLDLIKQVPVATLRKPGTLEWYGSQYDLEDFIAYMYYGHKREHTAQINVFRDSLNT